MAVEVRVIGFCDVRDKRHGMEDCTLFEAGDQFFSPLPIDEAELREYATWLGVYPSGKPGSAPGHCSPVYRYGAR